MIEVALSKLFHERIYLLIKKYNNILTNLDEIAFDLTRQVLALIPDDIRQICFLVTKLNQSENHKFNSWADVFDEYQIIGSKIFLYKEHIEKTINEIFFF